jgi:hypothetical protein
MKVLVAIVSCHNNKQRRDWQRQTWIPSLQYDYKFFLSEGKIAVLEDEVVLSCKDDYLSLPDKVYEIIKYARNNGYTRLLKLDDDVYVVPSRLEIPTEDYVGHAYGHKHYASGAAYWLSERAMDAILHKYYKRTKAEDSCIGETLKFHNIFLTEDHRYRTGYKTFAKDIGENEFPHPDNDTVTFHMWFPEFMIKMHANYDKEKQLVDATHFNSLKNR